MAFRLVDKMACLLQPLSQEVGSGEVIVGCGRLAAMGDWSLVVRLPSRWETHVLTIRLTADRHRHRDH